MRPELWRRAVFILFGCNFSDPMSGSICSVLRNASGTHLNTSISSSPQLRTEGRASTGKSQALSSSSALCEAHGCSTADAAAAGPSALAHDCVAWGSNSLPTQREPSTVLRQTTTASDSEVLTHPGSFKPSCIRLKIRVR